MYPKCSNGFFIRIENNKTKVSKPRFANKSAILRISSHFWVRINILYKIIQINYSLQRNYFRLLYSWLHLLWILHLVGYDFGLVLLEDDVCHTYITVIWILVPSTLTVFFFSFASFHAGLTAWHITPPNIILVQVQATSWWGQKDSLPSFSLLHRESQIWGRCVQTTQNETETGSGKQLRGYSWEKAFTQYGRDNVHPLDSSERNKTYWRSFYFSSSLVWVWPVYDHFMVSKKMFPLSA